MKIATVIFVVLGIILDFTFDPITGCIGLGVGIWMLATLAENKKSVAAGIFGILFTGLLGGIFYLCWTPEKE